MGQAIEKIQTAQPGYCPDGCFHAVNGRHEATRIIAEETAEICAIRLSMRDQEEMRRAMHEAGEKAYVIKGEPIEDIMATIRRVPISLKSHVSIQRAMPTPRNEE